MKLLSRTLSLVAIASIALLFSACKGGGDETPKEKVELGKLTKHVWTVSSVTLDGTDKISEFTGVKLTFTGPFKSNSPEGPYTYAMSGTALTHPAPWPASGNWEFVAANDGLIVRDPGTGDEQGMVYSISGSELTITFTLTGSPGWRASKAASVNGQWIFTFN